jgi:nucleoid-associated protein YgaU
VRITRLHLLITGIGLSCLFFGLLNWIGDSKDAKGRQALERAKETQADQVRRMSHVQTQENQAMEHLRKNVVVSIATVGEAYRPLRRQFGDIPPISRPLRAAKYYQSKGQNDQALASARESWLALKTFRRKVGGIPQTYQVRRGDTLWRIAQMHSPAHAGAGWVKIWKANQERVSNFNRLEIGWRLTIPPKRTQYIMPFWKPH